MSFLQYVGDEVVVETLIDLLDEFGRGLEIDLGVADVGVAHVSGEGRQTRVDVLAVSIPLEEAMDGEGVTKIVETGAAARTMLYAALSEELPEGLIDA